MNYLLMTAAMFAAVAGCSAYTVEDGQSAKGRDKQPQVRLEDKAAPARTGDSAKTSFAGDVTIPMEVTPSAPVGGTLNVVVEGLHSRSGRVCFVLVSARNRDAFGKEDAKPEQIDRADCIPVAGMPLTIPLENIPFDTYAVALYHDENSNGKMDKLGIIPTEGFGFSQNPPLAFPPQYTFEKCSFSHASSGTSTSIKVTYLGG